jgi:hypothetical protein
MAKNKVEELQKKSRFEALRMLRESQGFPVPPRKAVSQAKKTSKKLGYPVAPYKANPIELYRWGRHEWEQLGRWRGLAAPVALLVALTTWEKEKGLQEEYWSNTEKARARRAAVEAYRLAQRMPRKRKLLGIIPLPGRK